MIALAAHDRQTAEHEVAQAPGATPQDLLARAGVYLNLGDKARARADLDASIRAAPTLGALMLRAGLDGGIPSDAARADVDQAAKLAPQAIEPQTWMINAAMARHDYAAALSLLDRLLLQHPEFADRTLVSRIQLETVLGMKARGEADIIRAESLSGAAAIRPSGLCDVEVKARWRPQTALAHCEQALETTPKSTLLGLSRAILLHRLGRDPLARTAIAALETSTNDPSALNEICYGLAVDNFDLDRALADCDRSLRLRPRDGPTLDSRALVLLRLGRTQEALSAYDAALAVDPEEFNSMYARGLVEARLGRQSDSARDTAAALASRPQLKQTFADMGLP